MKKKTLLYGIILLCPLWSSAASLDKDVSAAETWISFLPGILFVVILLMSVIKLRHDGTKLSDLISEKEPVVPVKAADGTDSPAPQSVSRFIAFLTGLVALMTGVCITIFYMYAYFSKPDAKIDLSNLTTVIWGLGIGVLPYGFNKAATAIKPIPQ